MPKALVALLIGTLGALFWLASVVAAPPGWACSCLPAAQVLADPETVVFEGRVARRAGGTLRFRVDEPMSSGLGRTVDVRATFGPEEACGYAWNWWTRYRVTATRTDGELYTGSCSPRRSLGAALPASPLSLTANEAGVVLLAMLVATLALAASLALHQLRRPAHRGVR